MRIFFFFFFSSRRRHTRCGRDWSSDVCSSDLDFVWLHNCLARSLPSDLSARVRAMTGGSEKPVQNRASPVTVLLVDDDEFTHELMRAFLRDSEFALLSAFNAAEAIKLILGDKPPDVVITDAMMPG